LLCPLFADRIERKWQVCLGAIGIGVFGLLFARSTLPPALIALGVAVILGSNLLSYGFHNYQSELFPTRPYRKEDAVLLHTAFEDVLLSAPVPPTARPSHLHPSRILPNPRASG